MKYDIRQVYDWPLIPRAIVIGVICLIVLYLAYFFDFSNSTQQIKRLNQEEQDLKTQLASLVNKNNDVKNEIEKYSILMEILAGAQKKLTLSKNLPELLNEILKIGAENNLEFINFTPGSEEKTKPYAKVVIKATIRGTYEQTASFISQVANMDNLVVINNLVITRAQHSKTATEAVFDDRLTSDVTLEVYEARTS
jgi:Tfp pilus assembly protein PilO